MSGTTPFTASNVRLRRSYARTKQYTEIPNLIELQKKSYEGFLQKDVDADRRSDEGLQGVFKSVFPISDFNNTASLEFVSYTMEPPKYDVDECRQRGMTFASPLKVTLRLIVFDVDEETEARSIRDVKEQEVYLGEIPLMTAKMVLSLLTEQSVLLFLSFTVLLVSSLIMILERVPQVVSIIYSARVIPYRGSWLDFEFDQKDLLYVRIDRRQKTSQRLFLLKALGYDTQQILEYYHDIDSVKIVVLTNGDVLRPFDR